MVPLEGTAMKRTSIRSKPTAPAAERRASKTPKKKPPKDGFGWSPKAKAGLRALLEMGKKHGKPFAPFGPPDHDD